MLCPLISNACQRPNVATHKYFNNPLSPHYNTLPKFPNMKYLGLAAKECIKKLDIRSIKMSDKPELVTYIIYIVT